MLRRAMASVGERAVKGARSAVPGWAALDEGAFSCRTITGGLTNQLNLVELRDAAAAEPSAADAAADAAAAAAAPKALVRIFGQGTDSFIDRKSEAIICEAMARTHIAPRVYGTFPGGRAEEFIDNASSVINRHLHRPELLKHVARLMAEMHNVALSEVERAQLPEAPATPVMLRKLWESAARARFDMEANKSLKLAALQVGLLYHEVEYLSKELETLGVGRVLCHRDLQSGNVMVQTADGDIDNGEIQSVYLIDFEYSGIDYCAFDYGNTFNEFSINNFVGSFPGFVLDPDMYPTNEQQRTFFGEYLQHLKDPARLFAPGMPMPQDKDAIIDRLCLFARLGALCSHMQWILWGITQAEHSTIDFGHLEYSTARMDQYHVHRRAYEFHKSKLE